MPCKVQAYIYAKAVQDLLGYTIAAVLYINPTDGMVRGAYDPSKIGHGEIPGLVKPSKSNIANIEMDGFCSLLEGIEQEVEPYIKNFRQGLIPPKPRYKDACLWCPVSHCEINRKGS